MDVKGTAKLIQFTIGRFQIPDYLPKDPTPGVDPKDPTPGVDPKDPTPGPSPKGEGSTTEKELTSFRIFAGLYKSIYITFFEW